MTTLCVLCRFLKSLDAADKLFHNLQQEHSCLLQFTMTVALRLADKFHGAILIVQSFPWSPDLLSIVDVLAAQDGEASTGTAPLGFLNSVQQYAAWLWQQVSRCQNFALGPTSGALAKVH